VRNPNVGEGCPDVRHARPTDQAADPNEGPISDSMQQASLLG
jgi:hypothetical protein